MKKIAVVLCYLDGDRGGMRVMSSRERLFDVSNIRDIIVLLLCTYVYIPFRFNPLEPADVFH